MDSECSLLSSTELWVEKKRGFLSTLVLGDQYDLLSTLMATTLLWAVTPSGVDDGADIPREMVAGIYERIQQRELRSNEDHVTYVSRVEQSILGLKTVSSVVAPPFLAGVTLLALCTGRRRRV